MANNSETLSLLIISKFLYDSNRQDPRWCYLGLDRNRSIIRPVPAITGPTSNERIFFWPFQFNIEVGETHEFQIVPADLSTFPLPHRNNDVQVTHTRCVIEAGVVDKAGMIQILLPISRNTIEEVLGGNVLYSEGIRTPYVIEGQNCQSCGIYKRANFIPGNPPLQQISLVIFELARPLYGKYKYVPLRCFEKVVAEGLVP